MDNALNSGGKNAFENCSQLEKVDALKIPVMGYMDKKGLIHFYDQPKEYVYIPVNQIEIE